MYKFLKSMFSILCLCMQIMMKKTNYVILLLLKNDIIFELIMNFPS